MVPVNYLAVVVSAVAMFILGWLWYGVFFQKPWMQAMGWSEAQIAAMRQSGGKGMSVNYGIQALGALVMAFVLSHALIFASAYLGVTGISAGLQAAFWNWLGFIAPVTVGSVLWDGKSWKLWFINAGYYLAGLVVMGLILALWV